MRYHYDLYANEPIIRDYPVYDSANLEYGELLQLGTTDPDSGGDEGCSLITAYNATAANSAVDAIGILNEDSFALSPSGGYTGIVPSTAYSLAGGPKYGKVIINPFAIYLAEVSQAAADDVAITSTSSTTVTIPSMADDADGYWVYFTSLGATAGVKGSLRNLYASASGSATMDSALVGTGTSSDTVIMIPPAFHYSFNLTADAKNVASTNCQAVKEATNIRVLESYIRSKNIPMEPLRISKHVGLDNLHNDGVKFFCDLMLKDHVFGLQE